MSNYGIKLFFEIYYRYMYRLKNSYHKYKNMPYIHEKRIKLKIWNLFKICCYDHL